MKIEKDQILTDNQKLTADHDESFDFWANKLGKQGIEVSEIVKRLSDFQVAIPSWALGAGGTRFGRFSFYGEPARLGMLMELYS